MTPGAQWPRGSGTALVLLARGRAQPGLGGPGRSRRNGPCSRGVAAGFPALGRAPCSRPTPAWGAPAGRPGRGRPLLVVARTGGGEGTRARLQVRSGESSREGDPVLTLCRESGSGRGAVESRGCPAAVGRRAAIVPPEAWGKLGKKVRSVPWRGGRGRASASPGCGWQTLGRAAARPPPGAGGGVS